MIHRIGVRGTLLVAVVATIGCDRVTKHVASAALGEGDVRSYLADTIRLEYVENTGGFLGLGGNLPAAWRSALFTVFTGVVLSGIVVLAVHSRWRGWLLIGASLVVTGGASNWIDRVVHGRVVDFLNLGVGPLRTGVFNIADVAIMFGVVLLLLAGARPTNSDAPPGHAA